MTVRRNDQGHVRMPEPEFEAILARAAEEGAKRALADVGLKTRRPRWISVTCARTWNASARAAYGGADLGAGGHNRRAARRIAIKLKIFGGSPRPHQPARTTSRIRPQGGLFDSRRSLTTTNFYRRWRDLPQGAWRWPNFSPAEIACRGSGKLLVNEAALEKLQAMRDQLGKPLIVRSAHRSPSTIAPPAVRGARSTWRAPPPTSPCRTTIRRPSRRRRGRSASSASASICAQASCPAVGRALSRPAPWRSQRKPRPRVRFWLSRTMNGSRAVERGDARRCRSGGRAERLG